MSIAQLEDRSIQCPNKLEGGQTCGDALYVRHIEGGTLDSVQGRHYITNVTWEAECHTCQWQSKRRSTEWALIRYILDLHRVSDKD